MDDDESRLVPVVQDVPVGVDELTTKIVTALDMIAAIIPDLRKPHPATAKKVRGARTVSREAVSSIVAMVESSPRLRKVVPMDRAHEVLSSADAYRLLGERLEVLCAQVKYTGEARWAEVAAEAMQAYALANALARNPKDPEEAEIAAQMAIVRRHLGRRNAATGKRKKKPE